VPELPEVEVVRRNLTRWLEGTVIAAVERPDAARFEGTPAALVGATSLGWRRKGKMLLGDFSGGLALMSHLGMTGKWVRDDDRSRKHARVWLQNADGLGVSLVDPRRFGRTWIGPTAKLEALNRWTGLGPDALDAGLDGPTLATLVGPRKTALKRRLLEQSVVAGLGNIAVVELCWRAAVHPHAPCRDLDLAAWNRVAKAIPEHLNFVLAAEDGDEIAYLGEKGAENPFLVYGRAGQPCPRCATTLEGGALGGRPSVWCPTCQ